jgi:hypothetical protein
MESAAKVQDEREHHQNDSSGGLAANAAWDVFQLEATNILVMTE